jgi:hypothetical protein
MMLLYCSPFLSIILAIALVVFIALTVNKTGSKPGITLKPPGEPEYQELYDIIGAHILASSIDLRPKFVRAAFHDGMSFNIQLTFKLTILMASINLELRDVFSTPLYLNSQRIPGWFLTWKI